MGFSRQEYWSGLPFPAPQDFLTWVSNLYLLSLLPWQVGCLPLVPAGKPVYTMYMYVSIPFQILYPVRLLQNIEQSSLCYTVGSGWWERYSQEVCD